MADSLPLNGSSLKMKTKDPATMSMSTTQTLCVEHQNDKTKNKKCQSVRSEKMSKILQNKESTTNGLVAPTTTLSSIRKPTSRNEHQVK